jgi:hypothetical protein
MEGVGVVTTSPADCQFYCLILLLRARLEETYCGNQKQRGLEQTTHLFACEARPLEADQLCH